MIEPQENHVHQGHPAASSAVVVCHGNLMRAFRVRLERMTQAMFLSWEKAADTNPEEDIHNCSIFHYSRQDPANPSHIYPYYTFFRHIRPYPDPSVAPPAFRRIYWPHFSNEQLLQHISDTPQLLHTDPPN